MSAPALSPDMILRAALRDLEGPIRDAIGSAEATILLDALTANVRHALSLLGGAPDVPKAASSAEEIVAIEQALQAEASLPLPVRSEDDHARWAVEPDKVRILLRRLDPMIGDDTHIGLKQVMGGFSKQTFLVSLTPDAAPAYVLRLSDGTGPVPTSVAQEYAILASLHTAGVVLPEPCLLHDDDALFGRPCLVSGFAAGSAIPHTISMAVAQAHRPRAHLLAAFLADLHSRDPAAIGFPGIEAPTRDITQCLLAQIDFWEGEWDACRRAASPTMDAAFAWLRRHVPQNAAPGRIVHGDAGLHNMLVEGDRLTAMLDWELAHLGDPREDLRHARMWTDQILPWPEFLAHYVAHGGTPPDERDWPFFDLLDDTRTWVMAERSVLAFSQSCEPAILQLHGGLKYGRLVARAIANRIAPLA